MRLEVWIGIVGIAVFTLVVIAGILILREVDPETEA